MATLSAATGCFLEPPPPEFPTPERVAANARSIGIPYGPIVVFHSRQRYFALQVTEVSPTGRQITYRWAASKPGSTDLSTASRGRGSVRERRAIEPLDIGPLRLGWSRGSAELGWLYWSDRADDLEICSRTFDSLDDIPLDPDRLHWYNRDMFAP